MTVFKSQVDSLVVHNKDTQPGLLAQTLALSLVLDLGELLLNVLLELADGVPVCQGVSI